VSVVELSGSLGPLPSTSRRIIFCSLVLPGQVLEEDMPIAKAACFMASRSRIDERDSLRMYVFRKESQPVKSTKRFYGRPVNINERK
jgi:hypothetical protein